MNVLKGHTNSITGLLLSEDYLLSCSEDKTIKIWLLSQGTCVKTFLGHKNSVKRICLFQKGIFSSASSDSTIKFWSIKKGSCIHTLVGHVGCVNDITVIGNGTLVSGGDDKIVRFWNGEVSK